MAGGINLTTNAKIANCGTIADPAHVESLRAQIAEGLPGNSNAPALATSPGTPGQIAYDATHIYVCIATNTWVRAVLATF
jgi:hypothetical protein